MPEALEPNTHIPVEEQIARVHDRIGANAELRRLYDRALNRIDWAANKQLIGKFGATSGFGQAQKFLDAAYWVWHRLQVAIELGLHQRANLRILDLAAGAGYFCSVCETLGHIAVGIEPPNELYSAVAKSLEVRLVEASFTPRMPLPATGSKFDLITGYRLQFDEGAGGKLWTANDWRFLIEDLIINQMPPVGGKIRLSLSTPKASAAEAFGHFGGSSNGIDATLDVGAPQIAQAFRRRVGLELVEYFDTYLRTEIALGFQSDYYLIRLMFHLIAQADCFAAVDSPSTMALVSRNFPHRCICSISSSIQFGADRQQMAHMPQATIVQMSASDFVGSFLSRELRLESEKLVFWWHLNADGDDDASVAALLNGLSESGAQFCCGLDMSGGVLPEDRSERWRRLSMHLVGGRTYHRISSDYMLDTSLDSAPKHWLIIAVGDWDLEPEGMQTSYKIEQTAPEGRRRAVSVMQEAGTSVPPSPCGA